MNTGSPKLLVIPTPAATTDGPDVTDPQEKVMVYSRRKQQLLQEHIQQLAYAVWCFVSKIPGRVQSLPGYLASLKQYLRKRRVGPVMEPEAVEIDDQITSEADKRVLTPVIPFKPDTAEGETTM